MVTSLFCVLVFLRVVPWLFVSFSLLISRFAQTGTVLFKAGLQVRSRGEGMPRQGCHVHPQTGRQAYISSESNSKLVSFEAAVYDLRLVSLAMRAKIDSFTNVRIAIRNMSQSLEREQNDEACGVCML